MKYDDASWHYEGDFPEDLPHEAGATHIGMFLAWCLLNNLAGELHSNDMPESLEDLKNRHITPGAFLIEVCDGKFTDEDLSENGNAFAQAYYQARDSKYPDDYVNAAGLGLASIYHVRDSWDNFDKIAPAIKRRYDAWAERG